MKQEESRAGFWPLVFDAVIEPAAAKGGAFVRVPVDLKQATGKGRLKVHVLFENGSSDSVSYDGSIVNMGVKNEDGSICYILGVRKDIRKALGRSVGDRIHVSVWPAEPKI